MEDAADGGCGKTQRWFLTTHGPRPPRAPTPRGICGCSSPPSQASGHAVGLGCPCPLRGSCGASRGCSVPPDPPGPFVRPPPRLCTMCSASPAITAPSPAEQDPPWEQVTPQSWEKAFAKGMGTQETPAPLLPEQTHLPRVAEALRASTKYNSVHRGAGGQPDGPSPLKATPCSNTRQEPPCEPTAP